jgi:MFS family permease
MPMSEPHDCLAVERPPRRLYRWELLALLSCAFFFHQGDRAIFGVVLPALKTDLQLSDSQLGMAGSVLFATLAVLMPLTGYLGDVGSRKWIVTASVAGWSLATMLTGTVRGLPGLIAFRSVATAGGESFYAPAAYSLLAQAHQRTRALAMSVHQAALYLGVIASGFLGGYVAERWGWRSAFYVFGGCGVVVGMVMAFRLRNSPREGAPSGPTSGKLTVREAFGALFRSPTALLLTVGFTAIVFVNNAYAVDG